jgi:Tfp pilus assembly protein PilN
MKIGINLLPESKKSEIKKAEKFRTILGWEVVILCMGLIFFVFIAGIDYLLRFNLQLDELNKDNALSEEQYKTIDYYENKFSEINAKLGKISSITDGQLYWSRLYFRLSQITPDNIEITSLSTKNFSVFLAGKAKAREDLLVFKDKLSQDECFENVDLPLSNLVSKEDIVFQMDLEVKEACIKNK